VSQLVGRRRVRKVLVLLQLVENVLGARLIDGVVVVDALIIEIVRYQLGFFVRASIAVELGVFRIIGVVVVRLFE
jgi:hypothetical protein